MPCVGRRIDTLAPGAAPSSLGRPRGGCMVVEQQDLLDELTAGLPSREQSSSCTSRTTSKRPSCNALPQRPRAHPASFCTAQKSRSCSACDARDSRCCAEVCRKPAGQPISSGPCDESRRWLSPSSCAKMQMNSDLDFHRTKSAYDSLLRTEVGHSMDIEHFLVDREILNLRRAELLHKKWTENVFVPIQHRVSTALNPPLFIHREGVCTKTCGLARDGRHDVYAQRLVDYAEYLTYVNRKGRVFLDICQPSGYCPPPHISAVTTPPLNDPLLAQERARLREDCAEWHCVMGARLSHKQIAQVQMPYLPLVPQGRHGSNWNKYANMHLCDIDSPSRASSRLRMNSGRNSSQIAWTDPSEQEVAKSTSGHISSNTCNIAVQVDV